MAPFQTFLNQSGIMFKVERNNTVVAEIKGLPNQNKQDSRRYVGFMPGSDIQVGDCLVNPSNEKFYVVDTLTTYFFQKPSELQAYYETSAEHSAKAPVQTNIFNIGTATGSIIGTQSAATLNYTQAIESAKAQVETSDSPDKEDLKQVISLLEMIVNNQIPAQKGVLSKFADVIQRNSWITSPVVSILLSWLTSQIH